MSTIRLALALPESLARQAEALARQHNLALDQLLVQAIEEFVRAQSQTPDGEPGRVVNQGDIYWVQHAPQQAPDAAVPHPYVVVQDNLFNHSRLDTVVVCALTSNLRRVSETPGNVLLDVGEGNLPKQSVVEISKISTIAKDALGEFIGTLSADRVLEILAGMRFLQQSSFARRGQ